MSIHSFLKADKDDPDWQFSPEDYFGKEFKIIDASTVELEEGKNEHVVLRQNPTEKDLLAKHLKINLKKDSVLDLVIINDVDTLLQQVFLYDIHVAPGASLSLGMFIKDGKLNKHIVQVVQEESSSFSSYGLISNTVNGDTEVITKVVHQGPDSISNQVFFGMAGENSQTVYQGIAMTEPEAVNCHVEIENSNLVINEGSRCYSKPETYINSDYTFYNTHASTNLINPEKIGYLQSKGIPEKDAEQIILSEFRNQIIGIISKESIKEEIKELHLN